MDCIRAAADLQELLVAHSNAERQVSMLVRAMLRRHEDADNQVSELSQQSMTSALDGSRSQDLHLSLRLSVCEGVKVMYNSYQNKKWSQVQETARSIIQRVEGDIDSEQPLPVTSSPPGGRTSVDKAADKWSLAFCEFYRDS